MSGKTEFIQKAQGLMVKGQWYKALDQLEKAYAIDKSDPVITLRMGDIYVKLKDVDTAAQYYIKTAAMFAKQGETPKALATYKMALKTDPSITGVQDKINELAFPQNRVHPPTVESRGAINLSDSGNWPAYGHPADVLFGDHVELNDDPEESPSLQNTILLSELSTDELSELMGKMKHQTFDTGATVVREGEEGNSLYIIRKGKVKVVTRTKDKEMVLAMLGEGDFFGEVSFLTGRPRTADIITEEPSELMELCRDDLNNVIARHPNIEGVLRLFHENRVTDTLASLKAVARDFLK